MTCYWAKVGTPEKKFRSNDTQWSIKLLVEPKTSKAWVKKGLASKEKKMEIDGKLHPCILLTAATKSNEGKDLKAPFIVDLFGRKVDGDIIGNGSVVNVEYRIFDWEYGGEKGSKPILQAVQVKELVKRAGATQGSEFEYQELELGGGDDDDGLDMDDEFD
jgi:hypothetical protein